MKKVIIISLLILNLLPLAAQKLLWDVDFVGFFDNREYKTDLTEAQTIFGVRLSPEVGLGVAGNKHRIMAGASWIQPFGAKIEESKLSPTVYYRYQDRGFAMSFGMFPRTQLIEKLPPHLLYDSIAIFRPNIMGALFQYQAERGYVEAYMDWTQMQTDTRREAFRVLVSGRWTPNVFFSGGYINMNHLARSANPSNAESVMDNLSATPYVGADFTRMVPKLDTLALRVGYFAGIERHRGIDQVFYPNGPMVDFKVAWKYLGFSNTFYLGGDMAPFYASCGSALYEGDPFFRTGTWYNRSDVQIYFFRNRFVNCSASLNFHILPSSFNFQQQLTVCFNLNEFIWKDKDNNSKRPYLKTIF